MALGQGQVPGNDQGQDQGQDQEQEPPHYTRDTFSSAARRRERAERRRERISQRTRLLKLGGRKSRGSSIASDTSSMFSASTLSLARSSEVGTDDGDRGRDGSRDRDRDRHGHGHGDEVDESAVIGGPADFTMNIVELMKSHDEPPIREEGEEDEEGEGEEQTGNDDGGRTEIPDRHIESSSELEPPIDTSTPVRHLSGRHCHRGRDDDDDDDHLSPISRRELSMKVEDLNEEVRYMTDLLDDKCEELEIRAETIEAHCEVMQSKEELIKALRQELANATQQLDRLQDQSIENQNLLNAKMAHINELERKTEEVEALRRENQRIEVEFQSLEREVEQLRAQHHEWDRASMKKQANEESEVHKKQEEVEVKNLIAKKDTVIAQMTSEIDQLRRQRETDSTLIKNLEEEADKRNTECNNLEKMNDELTTTYESKISGLKSQLKQAQADSQSRADALNAVAGEFGVNIENKSFGETVQNVHDAVSRLAAEEAKRLGDAEASSRVAELEERLASLGRDLHKTSTENAELEDTVKRTRAELAASNHSIATRDAALESLRDDLRKSTGLARSLQDQIEQLNLQIATLNHAKDELQEELLRTHRDLKRATTTVLDLEKEKVKEEEEKGKKSHDNTSVTLDLIREIAKLRKTHQDQVNDMKTIHANTIDELNKSHSETIQALESRLETAESREANTEHELSQLRAKISSHDNDMTKLMVRNSKLEAMIEAKETAARMVGEKSSKVLRQREEKWNARVELLLQERESLVEKLKYCVMRLRRSGDDATALYEER
ncbi:hypothetical protein KEM54_000645 [Ascosphaera aggregata]|nr:hypothetical protein KEM54_000645 [Ascosphaera aggregata]